MMGIICLNGVVNFNTEGIMQDFRRLDELAKEMAQRDYLVKKRKQIASALNAMSQEEIRLQSQVKKETNDYKKLEGLSIKKLLAMFSDNYEEMMDKEYREMKLAEFKHSELLEQMQAYQDEIAHINELLSQYGSLDQEYNTLLGAKRLWATAEGLAGVEQFESELRMLKQRQTEIEEAIAACKALVGSLNSAKEGLSSAQGWGMFDIIGGGLITSLVKHDHINRASAFIKDASDKAKLLAREIADLKMYFEIERFEIDSFSRTFDTFFDNIFSDLSIQTEINQAYENICVNSKIADDLLGKLEMMRDETNGCIEEVARKRDMAIVSL